MLSLTAAIRTVSQSFPSVVQLLSLICKRTAFCSSNSMSYEVVNIILIELRSISGNAEQTSFVMLIKSQCSSIREAFMGMYLNIGVSDCALIDSQLPVNSAPAAPP